MNRLLKSLITTLVLAASITAATAQPAAKEQVKGLDEQVQDIKKDVLAISTELLQLEEKLLYPSSTQVSLFLSLAPDTKLRIDSVKLRIGGLDVAHHIYTYKELEALRSGGIQRLHTGNIRTGEHHVEVTVIGKTADNGDYRQVASRTITKAVEPKLVEIVLSGPGSGRQAIQINE
ncbi:MAG: hypothetical protein VW475_09010 [Curvibacter sp.]